MTDDKRFESLGLGPIEQVAYAVHNMERALKRYQPIYGAFEVYDAPNPGCTAKGVEVAYPVRIGTNNDGPIEIELLEPLDGPSVLTEHLDKHGEGLHHVRFRCPTIDEKIVELEAAGFTNVLYKRFAPDVAFSYLEAPAGGDAPILIELLQMP
jgi:catechol 2,3-dioxygenase-like lactoylglutathione lyase family enzyme